MEILSNFFGHIMRWIYESLSTLGNEPHFISYFAMTVLAMSVIGRLISMPMTYKMAKTARETQKIQPQLEELKKKYGYDERILQQKTMEFYKEHNLSMAGCSSCLPLIIQMVIVIALLGVMRSPGTYLFGDESKMELIAKNFFWVKNLLLPDYWFGIPLIYAVSQFLVMKLNPTSQQNQVGGMNTMMYTMPVVFYFISLKWASAVLLYWAFGNILELLVRLGMKAAMSKKKAA